MNKGEILLFLQKVDSLFPIKLSDKTDLSDLAEKFTSSGTVFSISENKDIVGLIAGYNNDDVNHKAYISVLAILPEYQGKGYASKLLSDFTEDCYKRKIKCIELFTHKTNENAIKMYKKNGFIIDENNKSRPDDIKFYKDI
jgi:ribosomal protein S18 acetylase RimI-like enzyme